MLSDNFYKMRFTPILLVAVLCLFSCTKDKEIEEQEEIIVPISNFQKTIELTGEQILKQDNSAVWIHSVDTLLMTRAKSNADHKFYIYSSVSGKYLGALGIKGNQPGAWTGAVTYNDQFISEKDGIKIWLYDPNGGALMLVNLTKTLASGKPMPIIEKKIAIDRSEFPLDYAYVHEDSVVYASPGYFDFEYYRIKKMNLDTKAIKYSDAFPKIKNIGFLKPHEITWFYGGVFAKHPNKNLFVTFPSYFDRVEIIDFNLELRKAIVSGQSWKDNYFDGSELAKIRENGTLLINDLRYYYATGDVGEKYIYALYIDQIHKHTGKTGHIKPVEIRVFDWDGNAVYNLKVPSSLVNISVDEGRGYIYGSAYHEEKIMRYDISEIL